MAYTVLARKWRPQTFDQIVGQEHITATLKNAITSNKISHGYLFSGTRGVGKTTAARILAKSLNCDHGPRAEPCGECESCKEITRGNAMDVLEIDGASNRGVEDIRELREQVKFAPMKGKYKVYIIDEVHMLTKEAFNALLKTLEEPPDSVVFIFATTEIRRVPQTILSRVQRFDFKRIPEFKIVQHIKYLCQQESINPEPEALEILSARADGSMRDALSLFDQIYAFAGQTIQADAVRQVLGIPPDEVYDELCQAIISQDKKACFETLEKLYRLGVDAFEILNGFSLYLRNLLFAKQTGISTASLGLSESRFKILKTLGENLQDGDIIRFGKLVSEMLNELRSAPNARLTLELGIAKMASLDKMVTISKLLNHALMESKEDTVKKKA